MLFVYLSALITTVLYFLSKPAGFSILADPWLSLSQLLALVGTVLFCLNYVLSSRAKFLENIFGGFDKLYKAHHLLGAVSFVLIINHPILLAVRALPNTVSAKNYIFVGNNLSYNLGIFSLYTLILVLVFTFIIKLPYHRWLSIHKLLGVPLLFAVLHVLLISSDVSRYIPLRLWIIAILASAVLGYLYKLLIYDYFGPIFQYTVTNIVRNNNISEVYLEPKGRPLIFNAGQYVFISFKQAYIPTESHPFTISSSPKEKQIRLSIKSLGDFTTTLAGLSIGSPAHVVGPYGKFGDRFFQNRPVVCIAGGIGITPFLSLISTEIAAPLPRSIYFYNCVKTESESIHNQEIINYQSALPNLKYFLHSTDVCDRLTAAKIKIDVPEFDNCLYFICGPLSLMESISGQLQQLGIKSKDIIYEDFSFGPIN